MNNTQEGIINRGDNYLITFIIGYLVLQALNNFIASIGFNGTAWSWFSRIVLAIFLFFAGTIILHRRAIWAVFVEILFSVLLLATYRTGKINDNFGSICFNLIFAYLPMGIACSCICNVSSFTERLYKASWSIEIISIINALYQANSIYSMSIGYLLLLPLLVHLDRFIFRKKWYDLVMVLIDAIIVFVFASRGPILSVAVFLVLKLLFSNEIRPSRKILYIILCVIVAVSFYIFYLSFANLMFSLLNRLGVNSRNLRLIVSGLFSYDAQRGLFYDHYIGKILNKPLLGYGLAGSWDFYSTYPHNLFIELFHSFGIPIGLLVSIWLTIVTFRGIRNPKVEDRRLSHIFFSILISLLWSGSFIMTPMFFVGLAILTRNTKVRVLVPKPREARQFSA